MWLRACIADGSLVVHYIVRYSRHKCYYVMWLLHYDLGLYHTHNLLIGISRHTYIHQWGVKSYSLRMEVICIMIKIFKVFFVYFYEARTFSIHYLTINNIVNNLYHLQRDKWTMSMPYCLNIYKSVRCISTALLLHSLQRATVISTARLKRKSRMLC